MPDGKAFHCQTVETTVYLLGLCPIPFVRAMADRKPSILLVLSVLIAMGFTQGEPRGTENSNYNRNSNVMSRRDYSNRNVNENVDEFLRQELNPENRRSDEIARAVSRITEQFEYDGADEPMRMLSERRNYNSNSNYNSFGGQDNPAPVSPHGPTGHRAMGKSAESFDFRGIPVPKGFLRPVEEGRLNDEANIYRTLLQTLLIQNNLIPDIEDDANDSDESPESSGSENRNENVNIFGAYDGPPPPEVNDGDEHDKDDVEDVEDSEQEDEPVVSARAGSDLEAIRRRTRAAGVGNANRKGSDHKHGNYNSNSKMNVFRRGDSKPVSADDDK